jgi:hypothetical protein
MKTHSHECFDRNLEKRERNKQNCPVRLTLGFFFPGRFSHRKKFKIIISVRYFRIVSSANGINEATKIGGEREKRQQK